MYFSSFFQFSKAWWGFYLFNIQNLFIYENDSFSLSNIQIRENTATKHVVLLHLMSSNARVFQLLSCL